MTEKITSAVKSKYAQVAASGLSSEHAGAKAVAEAFGYTAEELASIPAQANMGLSCGNPLATAHLKAGEVVVDLGSGGGLDVFLASKKVGPTGKAIGVDMTQAMIDRASKAAQEGGFGNVEFLLAPIDRIPLPTGSVDVVISNCVINLAPDKPAVFREIARILKPGGRLAVSDIALKRPLPGELAADIMAYVGCIAGAVLITEYESQLKAAGFEHVQVIDSKADLNAYAKVENQSGCCSPVMTEPAKKTKTACCTPAVAAKSSGCCTPKTAAEGTCCSSEAEPCCGESKANEPLHDRLAELLRKYDVNDYAASVKVFAVKPAL